eukprot:m.69722 g.69722  ORF g.69722 m.69722 type:complete len:543 (+) comp12083_c0_seq4:167-1795(+)
MILLSIVFSFVLGHQTPGFKIQINAKQTIATNYSLGNVILHGHNINVLAHYQKFYPTSLAVEYLSSQGKNQKGSQGCNSLLWKLVQARKSTVALPSHDAVVVHISAIDSLPSLNNKYNNESDDKFGKLLVSQWLQTDKTQYFPSIKSNSYYKAVLKSIPPSIKYIYIVSEAMPYADDELLFALNMFYLSLARQIFLDSSCTVIDLSGTQDTNFIFMAQAAHFVPSSGFLSDLARLCVSKHGGEIHPITASTDPESSGVSFNPIKSFRDRFVMMHDRLRKYYRDYRLGDLVYGWNRCEGNSLLTLCSVEGTINTSLGFHQRYPGSLGAAYAQYLVENDKQREVKTKYTPGRHPAFFCHNVKQKSLVPSISLPPTNAVVLHVRLGDILKAKRLHESKIQEAWETTIYSKKFHKYLKPRIYYATAIQSLPSSVTTVYLVSSLLHGSSDEIHINLFWLSRIRNMLFEANMTVIDISGTPDYDISFMSNAKYYIRSGGKYSALAGSCVRMLNGHECVPKKYFKDKHYKMFGAPPEIDEACPMPSVEE